MHVIARSAPFQISRGVAVGSSKWISLKVHGEGDGNPRITEDCLAGLKRSGYRIIAVSRRPDAIPIHHLDLSQKIALCLGHESHGLSQETHRLADATVCIPAAGFTRGFNVSVCAALCLATVRRALPAKEIPWSLSSSERLDLRLEWLAKMPKRARLLVAEFLQERGEDHATLRQRELSGELLDLIG